MVSPQKYRFRALVAGIVFALAGLLISSAFLFNYFRLETLKARGVDTVATVTEQIQSYSKGRYSYNIRYEYTLPDQTVETGKEPIPNSAVDMLKPGATIPVTYDPQSPGTSALDPNGVLHTDSPSKFLFFWFGVLINVIFGGIGALIVWSNLDRAAKAEKMLDTHQIGARMAHIQG
jgi:hypothetical protein